jgi:hypothetical protein
MKLTQQQNIEYDESLLSDQLKENQCIIDKLLLWIPIKQEQDRLKRIEYLNTLTLQQRRDFITSKRKYDTIDDISINMTNEEISCIDPDMLLIYNIEQHPFAFSLDTLYKNNNITFNESNEILGINLPIVIDNQEYKYHISTDDQQLDFELISSILFPNSKITKDNVVENAKDEYDNDNENDDEYDKNDNENDVTEEIKLLTFEKLSQLGLDFVNFDEIDDLISMYLLSGYTKDDISRKIIQTVLERGDLIN